MNTSTKYKYLLTNILAFLCGNIGTKLISFIMVPLYTNILSPMEYGEIDFILSIVGVISPFIACGIQEAIMRFSLDKNSDTQLVLSIGLRVFFISTLFFLLIMPIFYLIPIVSKYISFIYIYSLINEIMIIFLCYIRGKDNIKLYSFLGFLSGFLTAFFNILFLVIFKWGLTGYKFSMILSPFFTTIFAIILGNIKKDISIKKWNKKLAIEMIKYSLILIPNAILWWCINASDRFFVSYMCGTRANGLYAVSYKIPTLLSTISSILMQSWEMSAIKEYENKENSDFYNEIYRTLIFTMGVATIALIFANRKIMSVYVGSSYRSAWIYSPFLMASFFFGSLGTFWGSFYIATKRMNKYLNSAIVGASVNVVLNYILISRMGPIGAAIATMVGYLVVMIVRARGISNNFEINVINKEFISTIICLFLSIVFSYGSGMLFIYLGLSNIILYFILNKSLINSFINMGMKIIKKMKNKK